MSEQELRERVLQLERQMSGLQAEMQASGARQAIRQMPIPLRIAQVEEVGAGKVCRVKFVDGSFAESTSESNASFVARQLTGKFYVFNLGNGSPTVGSTIPVWEWSGHYWTLIGSSDGTSPPPASPDTAIVWVSPESAGLAGQMERPYDGCLWKGEKLRVKAETPEFDVDFCTSNVFDPYEGYQDIWITAPNYGRTGNTNGSTKFGCLPMWTPLIAYRVMEAFELGAETREVWSVQPRIPVSRIIQIGTSLQQTEQYISPDGNGIYPCSVFPMRPNFYGGAVADYTDSTPEVGTGTGAYAVEMKNRNPVRWGYYIGYEYFTIADYDGNTRPFYLFESHDLNQSAQWTSSGLTAGTSGAHSLDFSFSPPMEGIIPGVTFDTANDRFEFDLDGAYKFQLTVEIGGGASTEEVMKFWLERSTNGTDWLTAVQEVFCESGIGTTSGKRSLHLTELIEIEAGDFVRVRCQNTSGNRTVSIGKAVIVIDKHYGRANGSF